MSTYLGAPLRDAWAGYRSFWGGVISKANNLRAAEQRKSLEGLPATAKTVPAARTQH